MDETQGFWWQAPEGQAHTKVYTYVSAVESAQSEYHERLLKLAVLYDPYETMGHGASAENLPGRNANVAENVVASNIDTVTAIIAKNKPRPVFETDDGDWSTQRQARLLERYAEGLGKKAKVHQKGPRIFKDGSLLGHGLAKVYQDGKDICVERALVSEVIVDEDECRVGSPMQMHQRRRVDKSVLKAKYPEFADEIEKANRTEGHRWAGYMTLPSNQAMLIESWRLPVGDRDDEDNYVPGRHTLCIDGATLLDEEYHRKRFPFAEFRWNERTTGWYGRGLAEDIAGHQRTLNKLNWQIDQQLDLHAVPTTYVQVQDLGMVAQMQVTRVGRIVPYKIQEPKTVTPQAVSPQLIQRQEMVKQSSYDFAGVSRMQAHAMKPAGIESAVAMREYNDQTTERFAIQEQAYERWFLDVISLMLEVAKEMAAAHAEDSDLPDAPVISYRTRYLNKQIHWTDVDMGDIELQMQAASSLARTLAGRQQTVVEWAQAGVVTQDEARRLMQHPDLERELSLYNAAREDIERCIEAVLDGELVVPEPYQNLDMGVRLFQRAYLKALSDGAPEDALEGLREWIVQASHIQEQAAQKAAQMAPPAMPGAMPGAPAAAPTAAFAPQAMAITPQ